MEKNYIEEVIDAALNPQAFRRLTFSKLLEKDTPWLRITARPVTIRGEVKLQFSYFDGKRTDIKNFSPESAQNEIRKSLSLPFGQILLQTSEADVQVRRNRKGTVTVRRAKPTLAEPAGTLSHDRTKARPIHINDAFLREVGVATRDGKIRTEMSGKFHQINEFVRILAKMLEEEPADRPLNIIDCGCGGAYLTFAAFHYLKNVRNRDVRVIGIDSNADLIDKTRQLCDKLGYKGIDFAVSKIADYQPPFEPDVVLSLHACDTATDDAIAQAVRWKSRIILAVPCCQHELNDLIEAPEVSAILRHGILRERQADIVTDAFRASALRIAGYRTDIIEFVSPERTGKNLMIRAERGLAMNDPVHLKEYTALKDFWHVVPAIEKMLDGVITLS